VSSEPIQVLVVDADPGEGSALPARLEEIEGIKVVGVARTRRAAIRQAEANPPEVMLVDLMLPSFRSIDVIGQVAVTQPQVRILALSPGDPPHDRIILAAQAGALGFVTRDAAGSELAAAIQQVQRGEPWLPLDETYEVFQEVAPELGVSGEQRRSRLGQVGPGADSSGWVGGRHDGLFVARLLGPDRGAGGGPGGGRGYAWDQRAYLDFVSSRRVWPVAVRRFLGAGHR